MNEKENSEKVVRNCLDMGRRDYPTEKDLSKPSAVPGVYLVISRTDVKAIKVESNRLCTISGEIA